MPDEYGDWTDAEVLQWVLDENRRAAGMEPFIGNKIRYKAKVIFDKRFPNPDTCLCCGQIRN